MRTALLLALTIAACGLVQAAEREATYVVGNLDGIEPGAEGVLRVDNDRVVFRSGKLTIEALFAKIKSTEMGPKLNHPNDGAAPLYKVWQLHKRLGGDKTVYQNLNLTFQDASGKEQSMTLEMTQRAAAETHEALELRTGQRARRQQDNWWGDDLWRTNRNHQSWDQTSALAGR